MYDPATEILITTGATLGIHTALMALVSDGDGVLIPDPVYDAYQSPVLLAGGVIQPVRASIVQDRFVLTRDALEAAATPSSRVLILNTPWNPAGTVFGSTELWEIGEFVLRRHMTVISDEIYEAVVYDGHRHVSPASLSPEMRASTVLVNSLSKTYAMTGWRVGYCAAPASLISAMLLVLQQSSRGPATFIQDAAAVALIGPQDAVEEMGREYAARRARVLSALDGLPHVRALPPEGGFFVMVDVAIDRIPSTRFVAVSCATTASLSSMVRRTDREVKAHYASPSPAAAAPSRTAWSGFDKASPTYDGNRGRAARDAGWARRSGD